MAQGRTVSTLEAGLRIVLSVADIMALKIDLVEIDYLTDCIFYCPVDGGPPSIILRRKELVDGSVSIGDIMRRLKSCTTTENRTPFEDVAIGNGLDHFMEKL